MRKMVLSECRKGSACFHAASFARSQGIACYTSYMSADIDAEDRQEQLRKALGESNPTIDRIAYHFSALDRMLGEDPPSPGGSEDVTPLDDGRTDSAD